jgi:hydrogenase maturation protein HypF
LALEIKGLEMVSRSRFTVRGVVQGVGFRPFVYQLAVSLGLSGWVLNSSRGVVIEVEGESANLSEFGRRLVAEAPPLSQIHSLEAEQIPPIGEVGFAIRESREQDVPSPVIPADVAICSACAAEMDNPTDRRHNYPFINCTDCGPRFTIIEGIPYDRERTTMRVFTMCPQCRAEYQDPRTRRFHAEPNACPACGPHVWINSSPPAELSLEASLAAVHKAAELLRSGSIVAIKGLGGFHLACDARNSQAVARLRSRKRRAAKPFAVMCRDTDEVRRLCVVSTEEEKHLKSPQSPILLLRKRPNCELAPEVAPDNLYLGVMLPYTPLHRLLMKHSPPTLVMTSGNLSEEPIAHDNDEARKRLSGIADEFLLHNRPILSPCDDSVARVFRGELCLIRRSRGFVPKSIPLPMDGPDILACGAEQKNTFCIARGGLAVLSQHIGDMENAETIDYFERAVRHFRNLFRANPDVVAHDMHPGYHSTTFARLHSESTGARLVAVQHHHAHIVSCMVEHGLEGPVIGVAFDGTGYGTDGTVWGGEFLVVDYSSFQRFGRLRLVALPGSEAAIRRPHRMAYAHLLDTFGKEEAAKIASDLLADLSKEERQVVEIQIARGINSPTTSSAGRLFDAVSSLLGFRGEADYEGHPAVHLEMLAESDSEPTAPLPYAVQHLDEQFVIDTRPIIREVVLRIRAGQSPESIAAAFHATLAEAIADVCRRISEETGLNTVCLSGGCFQNALLLDKTINRLTEKGLTAYWQCAVPPNDGGLSLGQVAVARAVVAPASQHYNGGSYVSCGSHAGNPYKRA